MSNNRTPNALVSYTGARYRTMRSALRGLTVKATEGLTPPRVPSIRARLYPTTTIKHSYTHQSRRK